MAARGPLVFSMRTWHKHVKDMAPTRDLVTPLPWIEIKCAKLSLIPYHPHVLPLSLSMRSYEYNPFSQSGPHSHAVSSYMCFLLLSRPCLNLVAPPGTFWILISPLSLPHTDILSVLLSSLQSESKQLYTGGHSLFFLP